MAPCDNLNRLNLAPHTVIQTTPMVHIHRFWVFDLSFTGVTQHHCVIDSDEGMRSNHKRRKRSRGRA
ncbi:Uncharacterised protein [Vibrio cholerae]|nr:Uncharacterised protein [Vibrio cholerae]